MRIYWIYWMNPNYRGPAENQGFEEFQTEDDALLFINENPRYEFRIIEGVELKLKQVQQITKWELFR